MYRITFFIIFILISPSLKAQSINLSGYIRDIDDQTGVAGALVQNISQNKTVISDSLGYYSIDAKQEDTILIASMGYKNDKVIISKVMKGNIELDFHLNKNTFLLKEVTVNNPLTPYQLDSLDRRNIFGQQVDDKQKKFSLNKKKSGDSKHAAFTFDAPLTSIIHKHSAKYKKKWKFQEQFRITEEQTYIDTKYNTNVVEKLIGINADSDWIQLFINTHPMDYHFARTASSLEIQMWIMNEYKIWLSYWATWWISHAY